MINIIKLIRR